MVNQHRGKGEHKQNRDDQCVGHINGMNMIDLSLDKLLLILGLYGRLRVPVIVFLYGVNRLVCGLLIHASGPDHGHKNNEGQQGNPDNNRLAEPSGLVILDNPPEVEKSYDSPYHDKNVRFRFQQAFSEQMREKQVDAKDQHDTKANGASDFFPGILQLFGCFESRG